MAFHRDGLNDACSCARFSVGEPWTLECLETLTAKDKCLKPSEPIATLIATYTRSAVGCSHKMLAWRLARWKPVGLPSGMAQLNRLCSGSCHSITRSLIFTRDMIAQDAQHASAVTDWLGLGRTVDAVQNPPAKV